MSSETPLTDARLAGRDAGSMDMTPLEGMTDLARKLERSLAAARRVIKKLHPKRCLCVYCAVLSPEVEPTQDTNP